MKKITLTFVVINAAFAQAETNEAKKRTINFSRLNSTWYDYAVGTKKVGDKIEVDASQIAESNEGRPYLQRLRGEKFSQALDLQFKVERNQRAQQLFDRQMAE